MKTKRIQEIAIAIPPILNVPLNRELRRNRTPAIGIRARVLIAIPGMSVFMLKPITSRK